MQDILYTRAAFRQLASLSAADRARVTRVAQALGGPDSEASVTLRPLPGGIAHGLAQAAIEGLGRMVCKIEGGRVAILDIAVRGAASGSRAA